MNKLLLFHSCVLDIQSRYLAQQKFGVPEAVLWGGGGGGFGVFWGGGAEKWGGDRGKLGPATPLFI